ncbi:MAG: diheme cytochrome c [Gammaproteobacteria bacterium]
MKNRIIGGLIAATGIAAAGLVIGSQYEHEGDEHGEHAGYEYRFGFGRRDMVPVQDSLYQEECGACHFAYQPGLLPAASWQRLMDGLDDHFGDNAEVAADRGAQLRSYLVTNAADRVNTGRSPRIANSLRGAAPLRITETAYFRRQHDEIPPRAVADNPELGSFSRCEACHAGAADGSYDEHAVRIPGWGRWDD